MFVGLDACKRGWVAIGLSARRLRSAWVFADFGEAMQTLSAARVIGVDMPIGLLSKGTREADAEARRFLKGRSATVFDAPLRAVLRLQDHAAANELSRRKAGRGMSRQSFNLVPKIREVDAYVEDDRVHEVHPEVSFRLMHGALVPSKKTWGGVRLRLRLLREAGIELPESGPIADVGVDDVLDAAAVAWSARRIAKGKARSFPTSPRQRDRSGRAIAIWG